MTRAEMKRLARVCAVKMEPKRMKVVPGTRHEWQHDRGMRELVRVGGATYTRRTDITPRQYPIIRFDRVNGKVKSITVATPTAPLRRV